jgi:hypothetical protein
MFAVRMSDPKEGTGVSGRQNERERERKEGARTHATVAAVWLERKERADAMVA